MVVVKTTNFKSKPNPKGLVDDLTTEKGLLQLITATADTETITYYLRDVSRREIDTRITGNVIMAAISFPPDSDVLETLLRMLPLRLRMQVIKTDHLMRAIESQCTEVPSKLEVLLEYIPTNLLRDRIVHELMVAAVECDCIAVMVERLHGKDLATFFTSAILTAIIKTNINLDEFAFIIGVMSPEQGTTVVTQNHLTQILEMTPARDTVGDRKSFMLKCMLYCVTAERENELITQEHVELAKISHNHDELLKVLQPEEQAFASPVA